MNQVRGFLFLLFPCTMGTYLELGCSTRCRLGRTLRHRPPKSDREHGRSDTQLPFDFPRPPQLPRNSTPTTSTILKSHRSSSVSAWCGDIPMEPPTEASTARAPPRQPYFKLLSPSCSHCLSVAPTSALGHRGTNLWLTFI